MKTMEEMAKKFWRDIHPSVDWENTDKFSMTEELHKQMNTSYYDLHGDRYDMEAVFNICRQFAVSRVGKYKDINKRLHGYLPVVIINK